MPEPEEQKKVLNNNLPNSQFGGGFINAEQVNAGRIGGDIFNFFFGQEATKPVGNPARPGNQRKLLAAVKEEVTARLRQSLHNAVLINLGKESQPQQVKRPWDAEIKIGLKPAEPLPENTNILEIFDDSAISGKLLILGKPGSGKTTTMLELAKPLIKRAQNYADEPIPVLFELSSWRDNKQHLTEWLITELDNKYGTGTTFGKELLENHKLLLMLDGLDELKPLHQELCVQAINKQLLQGKHYCQHLVVCSRYEEYDNYETRLQLDGAIYLQPLMDAQICKYLTNINNAELWHEISNDPALLELVRTPFLLSVITLIYGEISIEKWQQIESVACDHIFKLLNIYVRDSLKLARSIFLFIIFSLTYQNIFAYSLELWHQFISTKFRIRYLLDAYMERMLKRDIDNLSYSKNRIPTEQKTKQYLVYLAQQLQKESQTEFSIENIQPSWLKNISYNTYTYLVSLFFLLTCLLISRVTVILFDKSTHEQFYEFNNDLYSWLMNGAIACIASLTIVSNMINNKNIKTVEILKFSNPQIKIFIKIVIIYLTATLPISLVIAWLDHDMSIRNVFFWVFEGGAGLWMFKEKLFNMLTSSEIKTKKFANYGIWNSALNAVITGFFLGVFFGWVLNWVSNDLTVGVLGGLLFGLVSGATFGGQACIQHFTLRLILYFNGYIPWNYARFLDYCTERMFLQRVGGRYRFIHKLLQDHFAQMDFK